MPLRRIALTPRTDPASVSHIAVGVTVPRSRWAGRLRREDGDFKTPQPCLVPDPGQVARDRAALPPQGCGITVGLVWRGGGTAYGQRQRSIALARWAPVLERDGVHAVSLLLGELSNERARCNAMRLNPLREFVDTRGHLDGLAALMAALDVVICVQGTAVHLAGTIGRPYWALIPRAPDGRYGQSG